MANDILVTQLATASNDEIKSSVLLLTDSNGSANRQATYDDIFSCIKDGLTLNILSGDVLKIANNNAYLSIELEGKNLSNALKQVSGYIVTDNIKQVSSYLETTISTISSTAATDAAYGSIKIGFSEDPTAKNYPLQLDDKAQAYVHVPWESGGGGGEPAGYTELSNLVYSVLKPHDAYSYITLSELIEYLDAYSLSGLPYTRVSHILYNLSNDNVNSINRKVKILYGDEEAGIDGFMTSVELSVQSISSYLEDTKPTTFFVNKITTLTTTYTIAANTEIQIIANIKQTDYTPISLQEITYNGENLDNIVVKNRYINYSSENVPYAVMTIINQSSINVAKLTRILVNCIYVKTMLIN